MFIGSMRIALHAPFSHSLKDKRMIVRSICDKVKSKFNISIAEVDDQDLHQRIVLGVACVAGTVALADSVLDNVLRFVEGNSDAQVSEVEREIL